MYLCVACIVAVNLLLEEKRGNTNILKNIEEKRGNANILKNYEVRRFFRNIEFLHTAVRLHVYLVFVKSIEQELNIQ